MNLSKDTVIQGITAATKVFASVAGLAAYTNVIPPQYLPAAVLVFALASTFNEGCTTVLAYLRGTNVTLTPTKPNV